MKPCRILFSLLLIPSLLAPSLLLAKDLVVPEGQTYIIKKDQQDLKVDKLVLGDKAIIKFADDLKYWDLKAAHVEIGHNVLIDGRGQSGLSGSGGAGYDQRAVPCESGRAGAEGNGGQDGGSGVDINLQLAVAKLNSLTVSVDGGEGGNGGDGAAGQQGGVAEGCSSTDGGDGGQGGKGGDGGAAGNLTISLSTRSASESLAAMSRRIEASAEGGMGGDGGAGGKGGDGSEGKYITKRTLAGNKKWHSGGETGDSGVQGASGKNGQPGRIFIGGTDMMAAAPAPARIENTVKPEKQDELEQLKRKVEVIERRLEALEKR